MDSLSRSKFTEGWLSLRTMMLMRMLFGFYCNISCNRILSFLARFYCICLAITVTILLLLGFFKHEVEVPFYLPLAIEYNLNFLVSIFTGENHLINFYKEIERMDGEMSLEHQPFMTSSCKVLFWVFCGYKKLLFVCIFLVLIYQYSFLFAFFVMTYSVMIGNVSRCIPLELLRLRLKHLWYSLEMDLKRENWRADVNQINSVIESLKLYRNFIDKLRVMSLEKFLICISFLNTFCFVLLISRKMILDSKSEDFKKTFIIFSVVDILFTSTITCLPAILCELIAKEVDTLKLVIGNALLVCDDGDFHAVLEGAADYLALRPFNATVCRAFALDASLVLSFISLCTTYTIVVIQYFDLL